MKKIIFLLSLIIVSSSYAQFVKCFGVKVGGTISHQNWDYTPISPVRGFVPDNKLGVNIGVFAELLDISFLNVITELNYVQKGIQEELMHTSAESPDFGSPYLWKLRIDYINVSLLAKPKLNLGTFAPYILLGPRIDVEINKSTNDISSFLDDFKKSRIGFKLGIGSEIKVLGFQLLADIVYDLDFIELYKNENVKVTSNSLDFRIGLCL